MHKHSALLLVGSLLLVGAGCLSHPAAKTPSPKQVLDIGAHGTTDANSNAPVSQATGGGKEGDDCSKAPPTCPKDAFQECVVGKWKCIGSAPAPAPAVNAPATNAPAKPATPPKSSTKK